MPAQKGKLNPGQQAYVVQCLACFDTLATIKANLKEIHGVEVSVQAIECYDPNKHAGKNLAERWKTLFADTRKDFLDDTANIGISHKAVRLRALNRMAQKAEDSGNSVLAAQLLKQAAEEVGNVYSNRRELTGKDGKDLPTPPAMVTVYELPDNGR